MHEVVTEYIFAFQVLQKYQAAYSANESKPLSERKQELMFAQERFTRAFKAMYVFADHLKSE